MPNVVKMQMSLGWISSLGHSIIRIATCQAKDWTWLYLHLSIGRKGIRSFFQGKSLQRSPSIWQVQQKNRCGQMYTHTHINTHIFLHMNTHPRAHREPKDVFPCFSLPLEKRKSCSAGEETCNREIIHVCRCHCETWTVIIIM